MLGQHLCLWASEGDVRQSGSPRHAPFGVELDGVAEEIAGIVFGRRPHATRNWLPQTQLPGAGLDASFYL